MPRLNTSGVDKQPAYKIVTDFSYMSGPKPDRRDQRILFIILDKSGPAITTQPKVFLNPAQHYGLRNVSPSLSCIFTTGRKLLCQE